MSPTPTSLTFGTRPSLLPLLHSPALLGALKSPDYAIATHSIGEISTTIALAADEATPLHDFEDETLWTHELRTLLSEGALDVVAVEEKDIAAADLQPQNLALFKTFGYADGSGALALLTRADDTKVQRALAPLAKVEAPLAPTSS